MTGDVAYSRPTAIGGYHPRMWDTPSRPRSASESGGDALGGPPDSSRPANPWPRLLAFGAVVLMVLLLAGTCLVSYARPPERELSADVSSFSLGVPKFMPVTTFGADAGGSTYGAWVTVFARDRVVALLSRDAGSLCHVRWDAAAPGVEGAGGGLGALIDPCGPGRYAADGSVLRQSAPHDLHAFRAILDGDTVVVNLTTVTLGACRATDATGCSPAGSTEVRTTPSEALPPAFGRQ